ncbi:MAG: hypothetical protein AAGA19_14785 [Pseudomonadota bacterium]
MRILAAVQAFDGVTTDGLGLAAQRYQSDDAEDLLRMCRSDVAREAVAGTWILKALLETGRADGIRLEQAFDVLRSPPDWTVALHLLQSVRFARDAVAQALIDPYLDHERTLLRVWALDALVRVAPDAARARVDAALHDTAASMRARARALSAELA